MNKDKHKDFDRNGKVVREWAIASDQVLREAGSSSVHMAFTSDKHKRSLVITAALVSPEYRDGLIEALNEATAAYYKSQELDFSVQLDRFDH